MSFQAIDAAISVGGHFRFVGEPLEAYPFGSGHIHNTFKLSCTAGSQTHYYLLQQINAHVFSDVPALMNNISRVLMHSQASLRVQDKGDIARRCLSVVPTRANLPYHVHTDGSYWRAYRFIAQSRSYTVATTQQQAYEVARAFGEFQQRVGRLPGPRLHESIADFHHTPKRVQALRDAVAANVHRRVEQCGPQLRFASARARIAPALIELQQLGKIPERVTHNDAKMDNVLFDEHTDEALCVVDLDTVMPGLSLYDFGDLVRSCANRAGEDHSDVRQVGLDMPRFEAIVHGYLAGTGDMLNSVEIANLAFSAKLISYELGVRFLTDYLSGDRYFKTQYDGQNLARCKVQFAMVESIEQQYRAMNRLARSIAGSPA